MTAEQSIIIGHAVAESFADALRHGERLRGRAMTRAELRKAAAAVIAKADRYAGELLRINGIDPTPELMQFTGGMIVDVCEELPDLFSADVVN